MVYKGKEKTRFKQKSLLLAALTELGVSLHISMRVDTRGSKESLPFLADVADDAGLGQEGRVVRNLDMAGDAHLPCNDAIFADDRGAGNAYLGRHHGMVADHYVVGDLAQIVDADAVPDDGRLHLSPVHGGVGTDFHIVADDDVPEVFDLLPAAVRLRGVAETVVPDDAAGVQDHAVANDHSRENADAGIDDAVLADLAVVADGHILVDDRVVPDYRAAADPGEVPEPHLLSELRGAVPLGPEAAVAAGFLGF